MLFLAAKVVRKSLLESNRPTEREAKVSKVETEVETVVPPKKKVAEAPKQQQSPVTNEIQAAPVPKKRPVQKVPEPKNDSWSTVSELRDFLRRNKVNVGAWGQGAVSHIKFRP